MNNYRHGPPQLSNSASCPHLVTPPTWHSHKRRSPETCRLNERSNVFELGLWTMRPGSGPSGRFAWVLGGAGCYGSSSMGKVIPPVIAVDTSRPRAGKRFEPTHELEVVPDALQAARTLPGAHLGVVVVSEMAGPNGIPDLTALIGDARKLEARLACPVAPLLNEIDAGIIAVTSPKLARTPQYIGGALGWPESTVRRRLPALVRQGALTEHGDKFARHASIQPLGRIYAIEAKVSDWRQALRQARTYALWADNYVLVLGKATEAATGLALEQVSHDRAGLVVGGEWQRKPNPVNLPPAKKLWAAEHFVAALRG